jgi:hypothetical protein
MQRRSSRKLVIIGLVPSQLLDVAASHVWLGKALSQVDEQMVV